MFQPVPQRLAIHLVLAGGLALAGSALPAGASVDDAAGTRDADACQADIHRLCDDFFPDETLVATCLVNRRASLSRDCAEVLARPPGDERN